MDDLRNIQKNSKKSEDDCRLIPPYLLLKSTFKLEVVSSNWGITRKHYISDQKRDAFGHFPFTQH